MVRPQNAEIRQTIQLKDLQGEHNTNVAVCAIMTWELTVIAPYISKIVMRKEQNAMASATELSAETRRKQTQIY